ncbi:MAG TPA: IS30 family transposase [Gallicola sp.]|nr:IS30 family transposase [Gallicola sp.]
MEHLNYITSTNTIQPITTRKFFNHLSKTDRQNIERLLRLRNDPNYNGPKITLAYIASQTGFNKSTISREIKRGTFQSGFNASGPIKNYAWDVGQRIAKERSNSSHQKTKLTSNSLEIKRLAAIINHEHISPEDAIDKYEQFFHTKFPVCLKTVYKYIRKKLLVVRKGILRFYDVRKKPKTSNTIKSLQKGDNISKRPIEAENRLIIGHWEGDTVYSPRNGGKECLLTLVDRRSRLLLAFKLPDRTATSVVNKFNEIENKIGTENFVKLFSTITFDNGGEFSKVFEMEKSSLLENAQRIKTYFANAYHSWERGSNENANGWIRYYFPKGTAFTNVSERKLLHKINKINFAKRNILNGISAVELFKQEKPELLNIIEQLGITNPYQNMGTYLNNII